MLSLLHEIHFWTQKDGVSVKDEDLGTFMYSEKKTSSHNVFTEGKKSYAESRGLMWTLSNKRPKKLRDSLREFEEILHNNRILSFKWRNPTSLHIVFSNGLQTHLKLNPATGDLDEISHDKFMIGKLSSQYVSDVVVSSSHAIFTYTDNQVTLVYFTKPALKYSSVRKWNTLDAKLQHVGLSGPTGRRLDKQLSFNSSSDMILIWWKSGRDEVYPWTPIVRDEDRANVHIYSVNEFQLSLLCFYRTEFDPIYVLFSATQPNILHTVQQRISTEGTVSLEWESSEINKRELENLFSVSFLLPTHSSVIALSPKEDKMFLSCIDGTLLMADSHGNVTNRVKASFIPSVAAWHPDGSLVLVGNDRGQIQWFDSALSCVMCQLMSEGFTPTTVLDVGAFFKYQPTLMNIYWNRKTDLEEYDFYDFLLLQFEHGPVTMVKLVTGADRRLTPDLIASQYLSLGSYDHALNLLFTIDWEQDGETALSTLQSIVSHMLRLPFTPETECVLEKALGSYHSPIRPIPSSVDSEFGDSVHDLSRRFFHQLLRYQVFDKAFRLAIDLNNHDLFMDIYYACKRIGDTNMALASLERAEEILCSSDSERPSCECSASSCSCSDSSSESHSKLVTPPLPVVAAPLEMKDKIKFANTVQRGQISKPTPEISPNAVGIPTGCHLAHTRYISKPRATSDYLMDPKDIYSSNIAKASKNYYEGQNGSFKTYDYELDYRSSSGSSNDGRRKIPNFDIGGASSGRVQPLNLGKPRFSRDFTDSYFLNSPSNQSVQYSFDRRCPPDVLPKENHWSGRDEPSYYSSVDISKLSISKNYLNEESNMNSLKPDLPRLPPQTPENVYGNKPPSSQNPSSQKPSSSVPQQPSENTKIKVVHFGLV